MRWFAAAAAVMALGWGFGARAAEQPVSIIQNPDWLRKPRPEDLLAVWPREAWRKGLGGKATIGCEVSRMGVLVNCTVLREEPAGSGYGSAALSLTPQFLMRPMLRDGKPVDGAQIRIPINFDPGPGRREASDWSTGVPIVDAAILWRVAPSYAEVVGAYPEKARAERVMGHVNLACTFTGEGALRGCETVMEEPRGYGFAKAGRALAEQFRGPTLRSAGKSISGVQVQLPFTFSPEMLDTKDPLIGQPKWAGLPTGQMMWNSFPAAAKQAGVKVGRVVLACIVQQEGKLACEVESQEPANYGFGDAALSLTPYFRLKTWTMEGLPTVGGKVRIPIRYEGETESASNPPPAKP